MCLAVAAKCPLLRVYVDNYINITPFQGLNTLFIAGEEAGRLRKELLLSGLLFHQFQGPTTRFIFLGWIIDTIQMEVAITEERKHFMIAYLEDWETKSSYSLKDLSSLIGLLIYIGQVVNGLRAMTAVLIIKRTDMQRSASQRSTPSSRIRIAIAHLLYILRR